MNPCQLTTKAHMANKLLMYDVLNEYIAMDIDPLVQAKHIEYLYLTSWTI